jgi:predicted DNA-binding mobile mystery protein A
LTTKRKRRRVPRRPKQSDSEFISLQRSQLDAQLGPDARLRNVERPRTGWIRAIRTALGMTLEQFGGRMHLTKQGAQEIEKREADDTITIASLRRAAEALDCDVIVALVPKRSLEATVTDRARAIATSERQRVMHTMKLEAQQDGLDDESNVDSRAKELATTGLRRLWD